MPYLPYDDAIKLAQGYRAQVLEVLKQSGYEVETVSRETYPMDSGNVFRVQGDYVVELVLIPECQSKNWRAPQGTPGLRFQPRYGTGRTVTWRSDTKEGWTDQSAVKHAKKLAEYIEQERRSKERQKKENAVSSVLSQKCKDINTRVGTDTSKPIYVSHNVQRLHLVLKGSLGVPEDQVEPLLRDLLGVLKTYGL